MKLKSILGLVLAWMGIAATNTALAAGETISLNFGINRSGGSLAGQAGNVGLEPVDAIFWLNVTPSSDSGGNFITPVAVEIKDQSNHIYVEPTLYTCSRGGDATYGSGQAISTLASRLLFGFLDDSNGSNHSGVKLANVPFSTYDVYVYFSVDTGSGGLVNRFPSYEVNGTFYRGDGTKTVSVASNQAWGTAALDTLTDGINTLIVRNQSARDLIIRSAIYTAGQSHVAGTRGCIAGVQIVNTGTPTFSSFFVRTLSQSGNWNDVAWYTDVPGLYTWENGPQSAAQLTVSGNPTLTIDENVVAAKITASGNGNLTLAGTHALTTWLLDVSRVNGTVTLSAPFDHERGIILPAAQTVITSANPSNGQIIVGPDHHLTFMRGATWGGSVTVVSGGILTIADPAAIGTRTVNSGAKLVYSGGAPLVDFRALNQVAAGATLEIDQDIASFYEVTPDGLPYEGVCHLGTNQTFNITGGTLNVTTRFKTGNGGEGMGNTVNHTGGTLIASGPANADYKLGPFVLQLWGTPNTTATTYLLSGTGVVEVPNAAAKFGADGTAYMTVSQGGVARFHSLSLRRGSLTVATGGSVYIGKIDGQVISQSNNSPVILSGGLLGTWDAAEWNVGGVPFRLADGTDSTIDPGRAAVTFMNTISGGGGFTLRSSGTDGSLTLLGTNTFSGAITIDNAKLIAASASALGQGHVAINGGSLVATNPQALSGRNITVQSGGILEIATPQTQPIANLALASGATLSFTANATNRVFEASVFSAGDPIHLALTLDPDAVGENEFPLFKASGINAANFTVRATQGNAIVLGSCSVNSEGVLMFTRETVTARELRWNTALTEGIWNTQPANTSWTLSGTAMPFTQLDSVVFPHFTTGGGVSFDISLQGALRVSNFTSQGSANQYTFKHVSGSQNNSLEILGNFSFHGYSKTIFEIPVSYSGPLVPSSSPANFNLRFADFRSPLTSEIRIVNGASTLYIDSTQPLILGGALPVTISGAATLTLGGTGNQSWSRPINFTSGAKFNVISRGGTTLFSGTMSATTDNFTLTKDGSGTLRVLATQAVSGSGIINDGIIELANGFSPRGTFPGMTFTVNTNAVLFASTNEALGWLDTTPYTFNRGTFRMPTDTANSVSLARDLIFNGGSIELPVRSSYSISSHGGSILINDDTAMTGPGGFALRDDLEIVIAEGAIFTVASPFVRYPNADGVLLKKGPGMLLFCSEIPSTFGNALIVEEGHLVVSQSVEQTQSEFSGSDWRIASGASVSGAGVIYFDTTESFQPSLIIETGATFEGGNNGVGTLYVNALTLEDGVTLKAICSSQGLGYVTTSSLQIQPNSRLTIDLQGSPQDLPLPQTLLFWGNARPENIDTLSLVLTEESEDYILVKEATGIVLKKAAVDSRPLTWKGTANGSGTWNTAAANRPWTIQPGAAATAFMMDDQVDFPSLSAASALVTVGEALTVGNAAFASVATAYTFTGSDTLIFGGSSVSKNGSAPLTFQTPVSILLSSVTLADGVTTFEKGIYSGSQMAFRAPIVLSSSSAALVLKTPAGGNQVFEPTAQLSGKGTLTAEGPGSLILQSDCSKLLGGFTVNGNVSGVPYWSYLPTGPIVVSPGASLRLRIPNTVDQSGRTFTGSGQVILDVGVSDSSIAFNGSAFEGTLRLLPMPITRAKLNDINLELHTNAVVQIDSGAQLFFNSNRDRRLNIRLSGTGNSEQIGAIRLGSTTATLSGSLTLLGDTTIGSNGILASDITVDPALEAPVTLTLGRVAPGAGTLGNMTLTGLIQGHDAARLNLVINQSIQTFSNSVFNDMGTLRVENLPGITTARAVFTDTEVAFSDVINAATIQLNNSEVTVDGVITGTGEWSVDATSGLQINQPQTSSGQTFTSIAGTLTLQEPGNSFGRMTLADNAVITLPADTQTLPLAVTTLTVPANALINIQIFSLPAEITDEIKLIGWSSAATIGTGVKWIGNEVLLSAGYVPAQRTDGLYLTRFGSDSNGAVTWVTGSGNWSDENAWRRVSDSTLSVTFANYNAILLNDAPATGSVELNATEDIISGLFHIVNDTVDYTIQRESGSDGQLTIAEDVLKSGNGTATIQMPVDIQGEIIVQRGNLLFNTPAILSQYGSEAAEVSTRFQIAQDGQLSFLNLENQLFVAPALFFGTGKIRFESSNVTFRGTPLNSFRGIIEVRNAEVNVTSMSPQPSLGFLPNAEAFFHIQQGGRVVMKDKDVIGWSSNSSEKRHERLFAVIETGGQLIKASDAVETATRSFELRGGSLVNETTLFHDPAIVIPGNLIFALRSGITVKAVSGYTSEIRGPDPFAVHSTSAVSTGSRTNFDVEDNAYLLITAPFTNHVNSQPAGNYGIRKIGKGKMVLSGVSSHTSPTDVNEGLFAVHTIAEANGSYTVQANAVLAGNGQLPSTNATVTVNGTLSPGGIALGTTAATGETLTVGGRVVFNNGAILEIRDFSKNPDQLVLGKLIVNGSITVNGAVTVKLPPLPAKENRAPSYSLIDWAGPPANTAFVLNDRDWQQANYVLTSNVQGLRLVAASSGLLRWGKESGDWFGLNVWYDFESGAETVFDPNAANGTSVLFNDIELSSSSDFVDQTTVQLGNQNPTVVAALFDNTETAHQIAGLGTLRFNGDIRKNGTGRVDIGVKTVGPRTIFINEGTLAFNNRLATSDQFDANYLDLISIYENATLQIGVGPGLLQRLGGLAGGGRLVKTRPGTLLLTEKPALALVTVMEGTLQINSPTLNGYPEVHLVSGSTLEWIQNGTDGAPVNDFTVSGRGHFIWNTAANVEVSLPAPLNLEAMTKTGTGTLTVQRNTFTGKPDLWLASRDASQANALLLDSSIQDVTPLSVRNFGTRPGTQGHVRVASGTPASNRPILTDLTQDCEFNGSFTSDGNAAPALNLETSDTTRRKTYTISGTSTGGRLTVDDAIDLRLPGSWGAGAVIVKNNATLSGTGLAQAVTLEAGATLTGGLSGQGTLTIDGTLTFNGNATIRAHIFWKDGAAVTTQISAKQCTALTDTVVLVSIENPESFYLQPTRLISWGASVVSASFILSPEQAADYILENRTDGLYVMRRPRKMWIMTR